MLQKKSHLRLFLLGFLLCLSFSCKIFAQTTGQCDSIIRKGIEHMQRNEHVRSLELLTQARVMAEKKNWHQQEFLAINNIGANYYMMLEYGEALNHYLEAYTISLKYLEPQQEMIVLNNIAILYSKEKKYDQANDYFKKAYDIAKKNKDHLKMGLYAMNLGNVANETKQPKLARAYFNESLPLLVSQPQFVTLAKIGLADCDLSEGNTKQSLATAKDLYANTKDLDFNDVGISLLTIISKSYLKENNLQLASAYANKILQKNPNLETKIVVFDILSELNFKARAYDKALQLKDSIITANAGLDAIKNGKLFENSKVKFEIQNYKNEIALNEAKLANERKLFYSIIAIIIIIVFFVILTFRNLSIKHKQKKLIAERSEQILALELEKEKSASNEKETIALLELERLKNELESRNRKLSAKALYLSGRNQMIEEVLSELSELPQLSKDTSVVSHIKTLKNHLKTDNEWDNFITHFEEVNHTFLQTLKTKHPNLAANDIRFISYIYMNLSTKEIASMLNVTAEACRKRKERISAKMELPENINLYDYLASL
ncbi:MAG TPA: tetratricopeptide repeat protein [Flavobacterium sp.]|nr:tetratricopeptide repeat protein [Flavobacterium sp.]